MDKKNTRYHALDALRGLAMLLGILLHSALAYMRWPLSTWPIRDPHAGIAADVLVYAIHGFRMQLFFLLAGFFGCLVYKRYGRAGFIRHRFRRICVPLFAALILIQPQLQAIGLYHETVERRAIALAPSLKPTFREYLFAFDQGSMLSPGQVTLLHFTRGTFVHYLTPMHLWFLYYLLLCYAIVVLGSAVLTERLRKKSQDWAQRCLAQRFSLPALVILTLPLLYRMQTWQVDSSSSWLPVPRILLYYFGFFAVGWILNREQSFLRIQTKPWKWYLAGALVSLALAGLTTAWGLPLELTSRHGSLPGYFAWLKLAALSFQSLYTWLMIWGMIGAFEACLGRAHAAIRYLADASYWCYLASLIPVLVLQDVARPWPVPGGMKLLFVVGTSFLFLLVTYECFVRYTFIGAFLHGRKTRSAPNVEFSLDCQSSDAHARIMKETM